MAKTTFSVRISKELVNNTRSCVFANMGNPHYLTLVGVTEAALKRGIKEYEDQFGEAQDLPEGEKPGFLGRRPGVSSPPPRKVHSVNVEPWIKKKVDNISYALRVKSEKECNESISQGKGARPYFEFATWVEKYLSLELEDLKQKVGEWSQGDHKLRAGRRMTFREEEDDSEEQEVTTKKEDSAKEAKAKVKGVYDPEQGTYSETGKA